MKTPIAIPANPSASFKKLNPDLYGVAEPPSGVKTATRGAQEAGAASGAATKRALSNENNHRPEVPRPKPQRHKAPALVRADAGEEAGLRRARVRFVGHRVRPLDPDNFAGGCKDLLDGLRHAGLIPGDEPWRLIFETEQVRVRTFAEERTVIEVDQ